MNDNTTEHSRILYAHTPPPVYTERTECQDCYKCVRACPLKAINVENATAMVNVDKCIFCGECTRVCPARAKRVRDDLPFFRSLIREKKKIILSIAPAFRAEFPNVSLAALSAALKTYGVIGVSETAHGADRVSQLAAEEIQKSPLSRKLFISTACPAIVRYIECYRQDLLPYFIEAPSPLHVHATALKMLHPDADVVFVGPCAAKKHESDFHSSIISCAIGFYDLVKMMSELGIDFYHLPEADEPLIFDRPAHGILYPMDKGMCRSIQSFKLDTAHSTRPVCYLSAAGMRDVMGMLQNLDPSTLEQTVFLELLACQGGCLNGPMTKPYAGLLGKQLQIENEMKNASKEPKITPVNVALSRKSAAVEDQPVTVEQLTAALLSVGKDSPEKELNCSGCGYDSCRDFAHALALGRAEKTMCVSYMRTLAQRKASALMNSMPSGAAIIDDKFVIVEANRNFAQLLGEEAKALFEVCPGLTGAQLTALCPEITAYVENVLNARDVNVVERQIRHGKQIFQATVFSIEKSAYAGVIVQDMTVPGIARDKVIAQAQSMIEKQLSTVQNIAWLLGENAAESEAILNEMIETFKGSADEQ